MLAATILSRSTPKSLLGVESTPKSLLGVESITLEGTISLAILQPMTMVMLLMMMRGDRWLQIQAVGSGKEVVSIMTLLDEQDLDRYNDESNVGIEGLEESEENSSCCDPNKEEESEIEQANDEDDIGNCRVHNKQVLLRLLAKSSHTIQECSSQFHTCSHLLGPLVALSKQQCESFCEMIRRMDDKQFDQAGSTSVQDLVDQWRNDMVEQMASLASEATTSLAPARISRLSISILRHAEANHLISPCRIADPISIEHHSVMLQWYSDFGVVTPFMAWLCHCILSLCSR